MNKAYAYSLDDAALAIATREQASQWLFKHLQAYMLDGVEGDLFQGEFASAMQHAPRAAFDAAFDEIPALRRSAAGHLALLCHLPPPPRNDAQLRWLSTVCSVRVPFLDAELVRSVIRRRPVHLKRDETIQRHILRAARPEFLSVINANVGAPMTAGPFDASHG